MKRYCIVGIGNRGLSSYGLPLVREYADAAQLVAICDLNPTRLRYAKEQLGIDVALYTDFDAMLREVPSDVVIVTTKDSIHHEFIVKALESGRDAITEKPMTTHAEGVRAVLEAERRTGRKVHVTFNVRHGHLPSELRRLVQSGVVGKVHSVEKHYTLNTLHGADYYRRWHGQKENSGGLLIHKATHHFDMVNWIIDAEPQTIYAHGARNFYGPTREERGERCLTCNYKDSCEFYFDVTAAERTRRMYVEAEGDDGYFRDRCVFSPEINIEDTMHLAVSYTKGILFNYSLVTYAPFEGYRLVINGDKGRLEVVNGQNYAPSEQRKLGERSKSLTQKSHWVRSGLQAAGEDEGDVIHIFPTFGGEIVHHVPRVVESGGHGGTDKHLRNLLFQGVDREPELGRAAGSWEGAMSVLIGVAANQSMETGRPVHVADLLGDSLVPEHWRAPQSSAAS